MSKTYCFSVHLDATPGSLPRVLEVFAHVGLVPERCHSQLLSSDELVVDVHQADLSAAEAAHLAKRLGRIVGVSRVLWSERRRAA